MIKIRKAKERGKADFGWLKSFHTFSFGQYFDPAHMEFRQLRVINDDRVAPGKGFGAHPHRDMEIISYVVEGNLEHKDSMGNGSTIRPGDVQVMSAGKGVTHSEFNPSAKETVHFLQIWIQPREKGLAPGYQQKNFTPEDKKNKLCLIAAPDKAKGALQIHQDAFLYSSILEKQNEVKYDLPSDRYGWLQVVTGTVSLNGTSLQEGDGAAISKETSLRLQSHAGAEILLFDLS